MTSVKDVLQTEFNKYQGRAAALTAARVARLERLLAMGDRWLTDNEAQVREEFPALFVPVPSAGDVARGVAEHEAGGKDALIRELQGKLQDADGDLGEAHLEIERLQGDVTSLKGQLAMRVEAEGRAFDAAKTELGANRTAAVAG
jgi:hypothetical protein